MCGAVTALYSLNHMECTKIYPTDKIMRLLIFEHVVDIIITAL
jgi:hypothetical protein